MRSMTHNKFHAIVKHFWKFKIGNPPKIPAHYLLTKSPSRILFKKTEVADLEATHFAIFYNNALYLFITLILSFYILKNFR